MALQLPKQLEDVLHNPLAALMTRGDRPVVAFMSNNVPVELIHAAGCFPLQLPTTPLPSTEHADEYLEPRFDPLVRNVLEQLLRGDLAAVDLLVLPRTVDSMQRLYYYLAELKRSFGKHLPEPFLYDLLHTPWYSSAEYNYARTLALQSRLEQLTGRPVLEGALRESIRLYNAVRVRIDQLLARRRADPCALAGELALPLFAAAQRVAPEALCQLLDQVLDAASENATGTRTLLVGSAHDSPSLHRAIADAGGQVVSDHHWLGDLLFGAAIDEQLPPLRALSTHYHRESESVRRFPTAPDTLVRCAKAAHAEVAVFFYWAEEEALTWDYAAQRRALVAAGIPVLLLARQAYPFAAGTDSAGAAALRAFFDEVRASAGEKLSHA